MAVTCPECQTRLPEKEWHDLQMPQKDNDYSTVIVSYGKTPPGVPEVHSLTVRGKWMICSECGEILVQLQRALSRRSMDVIHYPQREELESETWLAVPRRSARPVDPLVPEPLARDYREASAILDLSPRASAILARRVLADLLETYAGRNEYGLTERIDLFTQDTSRPYPVRESLHHLREAGDLSAHTKKDDQAIIIDVDRAEAEWTLDVLDRLFDYFIVTPARDRAVQESIADKVNKARRKPITKLPDAPPSEHEVKEE